MPHVPGHGGQDPHTQTRQNRRINMTKEIHHYVQKEPQKSEDRGRWVRAQLEKLLVQTCQKRPINLSKETHNYVRKEPHKSEDRGRWVRAQMEELLVRICQKRPIHLSKETHKKTYEYLRIEAGGFGRRWKCFQQYTCGKGVCVRVCVGMCVCVCVFNLLLAATH